MKVVQSLNSKCFWSNDISSELNFFETSCGHSFELNEGSPSDNDMKFCCFCGLKLKEIVV